MNLRTAFSPRRLRRTALAAAALLAVHPSLPVQRAALLHAQDSGAGPLPSRAAARLDSLVAHQIAPGVHHARGVDVRGPWHINVLTIDLARTTLGIESARAGDALIGRETTTSLGRRGGNRGTLDDARVLAAVNADFFNVQTGEQLAHQVVAGSVVKGLPRSGATNHGQFMIDATGRPHIGTFDYAGSFAAPGHSGGDQVRIMVDGVNALPTGPNGLTLFTGWAGARVPDDTLHRPRGSVGLRRASARGDTILWVRAPRGPGAGVIPTDGAVLAGYGASRARLAQLLRADTLRLVNQFAPVAGTVRTMVGGRPILIEAGRDLTTVPEHAATFGTAFSTTRHPRTAVGILGDGHTVVLVTVDGRQPSSAGMSLAELSALLADLGARDALNLDGGGSTTMVVGDTIVNRPSDAGGERTVANVLLVVERQ